jgi:hypothetical protein
VQGQAKMGDDEQTTKMNSTTNSLHPAPPTTAANQHFFQSFKKCKVDIATTTRPQRKKYCYQFLFELLKLQL